MFLNEQKKGVMKSLIKLKDNILRIYLALLRKTQSQAKHCSNSSHYRTTFSVIITKIVEDGVANWCIPSIARTLRRQWWCHPWLLHHWPILMIIISRWWRWRWRWRWQWPCIYPLLMVISLIPIWWHCWIPVWWPCRWWPWYTVAIPFGCTT